jgi:hypothetical protein
MQTYELTKTAVFGRERASIWPQIKLKLKNSAPSVGVIGLSETAIALISLKFLMPLSLRLDETQSMIQVSHSYGGLLHSVASDVHVPLYHTILHFWMQYVGTSAFDVRLLSLIFFGLSVPLFYLLARQFLSRNWSLLAVALFALNPFLVWFGSEARMYSLLVLVTIVNQLFFVKLIKKQKGWLGYALSGLVGIYTHYFFFFILAAQAVYYLFNQHKFGKHSLRKFMATAVLLAAAIAPWLIYVASLGKAGAASPKLPAPGTVDFFNAYAQLLFGYQTPAVNTILLSLWPMLLGAAFLTLRRGQPSTKALGYLAVTAVLPVVLAFLLSFIHPFFLSRYLIAVLPALLIVLVWFISKYGRRLAYTGASLLLLASVGFGLVQDVSAATPEKQNYQAAVNYIEKTSTPSDVVVLSAPFTIYPFEQYYNGNDKVVTLPRWDRIHVIPPFNKSKLPEAVKQINKHHRYVYLLLSQNQGYEKTISHYYRDHFKRVYKYKYSHDLTLYKYKIGYYKVPQIGTFNKLDF